MRNNIFDKHDIEKFFGTKELPKTLPLYYYLMTKKKLEDVSQIRFEKSDLYQGEIVTSPFWKPISKIYLSNEE